MRFLRVQISPFRLAENRGVASSILALAILCFGC
jgi:hypothetical protein